MKKSIKNKAIAILACLFAIALSCTFIGGNVSFAKAEDEGVASIVAEFKGYVETIDDAVDPASGELKKENVEDLIADKNYSSAILAANRIYKDVKAVENPDDELLAAIRIFEQARAITAEPIALYNYLTSTLYDQIKASSKTTYSFEDGLTLSSQDTINSYRDRYNALTGNYKKMVDDNAENAANFGIADGIIANINDRLTAANNALAAISVWDGTAAMASNATLTEAGEVGEVVYGSKETIEAARTALNSIYAGIRFEDIPAAELAKVKEVVTNYDKYFDTAAESQQQEVKMNAILAAIENVQNLIKTAKDANEETGKAAFEVGKVTKTIESYITAAKDAMDLLPDSTDKGGNNDQQGAVNNAADLTAMVAALDAINGKITAAIEAIKLLGDNVEDVKNKVKYGTSEATIADALEACNALDEDVKGGATIVPGTIINYVTNYDVYEEAVKFYKNMNDKVTSVIENIFALDKEDPNVVSAFNRVGYDSVNETNYGADNAAAMLNEINTTVRDDRTCFEVYEEFRALVNKINAEADKIYEILQKTIDWVAANGGVKPAAELKTLVEAGRTELSKYVDQEGNYKGDTDAAKLFNSQIISAVSNKDRFEEIEREFNAAVKAVKEWREAVEAILTMDFDPASEYANTIKTAKEKWNGLNDTLKGYAEVAEPATHTDYVTKTGAYDVAKEKLDDVVALMADLDINTTYTTHETIATFVAAVALTTNDYAQYLEEGSDPITGAAAYIEEYGEGEAYNNYLKALQLCNTLGVVDKILSIPEDNTATFKKESVTIADTTIEVANTEYTDADEITRAAVDAYNEGVYKTKLENALNYYAEIKTTYDALIERVEAYVKVKTETGKYDLATVINVDFNDLINIYGVYSELDDDAKHYVETHFVNETLASDIAVTGTFKTVVDDEVVLGTFELVYGRAYAALTDLLDDMMDAVAEGGFTPAHIGWVEALNARYSALSDSQKNDEFDEGATIVYSVSGTEIHDLVDYYKNTFSNEYSKNVLVNYFEKACEKVYENVVSNKIYTQDTAVELYTLHALFASMTEYQASLAGAKAKLDEATAKFEAATKILNVADLEAEIKAILEQIGTVSDDGTATGIRGEINSIKAALESAASTGDMNAVKGRVAALEAALDASNENSQISLLKKALEDKITALSTSLTEKEAALRQAYADADAALKTAYENADATLRTELETAFANADASLKNEITAAYEAAIATAKSELEGKLNDQKTAYETLINNTKTALEAKDTELNGKITSLTNELNSTKSALEAKDAELEALINKVNKDLTEKYDGEVKGLKDTITVISVIFGILIAACAACVVVLFIKKR